jgi:hypothetical protein
LGNLEPERIRIVFDHFSETFDVNIPYISSKWNHN